MIDLDALQDALLGNWFRKREALTFGHAVGVEPASDTDVDTTSLTLIGPKLLDEFRLLIERTVQAGTPGDIVETGVWRGGACIWAAAVLENLGSDKRVYCCDSYAGLPPATHPKETIDFSTAHHLAVPLEEVEANFRQYELIHRAVFVKGWFKDTMPTLNIPVAVLRLDGDMYESTNDVLRYMYDRVTPGGYVIVDDYVLPSCRRAVDEFRSRRRLRGSLQRRAGAWWQKPGVAHALRDVEEDGRRHGGDGRADGALHPGLAATGAQQAVGPADL